MEYIPELHNAAFLLPLIYDSCICRWFIHTRELPQEPAPETVWVQPEITHEDIIVLETYQLSSKNYELVLEELRWEYPYMDSIDFKAGAS